MKDLNQLPSSSWSTVFTDIDGTMTQEGRIDDLAYTALWNLYREGISVIPVTGRPAGWCEMIARTWPVHGVIGENGAFYFRFTNGKMKRHFFVDDTKRLKNRHKLDVIQNEVLKNVPGSGIASDQFTRLFDLAIDFSEDVPLLSKDEILNIVKVFENHGAIAKVSNIHVNGWFGDYDKLSACKTYCEKELNKPFSKIQNEITFIGDSPNDEPMFKEFQTSFAVANIKMFSDQLVSFPTYVASEEESLGFNEVVQAILASRN